MPTKIEWVKNKDRSQGVTWNPITGCTKISEGCQHCYAERMSKLLAGRYGYPKDKTFSITIHKDKLEDPVKLKKPSKIFVCSMGDLFHEQVPMIEILNVFDIMHQCPQHTFNVLTKRPERMLEFFKKYGLMPDESTGLTGSGEVWPTNVWAGVTCENQQRADERIPLLLQVPAAVRFVSYEPALGPLDAKKWIDQIQWIIVGGETGPSARPIEPEWIKSIRNQCIGARVPFFFKSWGEWVPHKPEHGGPYFSKLINTNSSMRECTWNDGTMINAWQNTWCTHLRVGKKRAGRILDGRTWDDMPETVR